MPSVDTKEIEEKCKDAVKKSKDANEENRKTFKLLKTCPNVNS